MNFGDIRSYLETKEPVNYAFILDLYRFMIEVGYEEYMSRYFPYIMSHIPEDTEFEEHSLSIGSLIDFVSVLPIQYSVKPLSTMCSIGEGRDHIFKLVWDSLESPEGILSTIPSCKILEFTRHRSLYQVNMILRRFKNLERINIVIDERVISLNIHDYPLSIKSSYNDRTKKFITEYRRV